MGKLNSPAQFKEVLEFGQRVVYNLHKLYVFVTRRSPMHATSENILAAFNQLPEIEKHWKIESNFHYLERTLTAGPTAYNSLDSFCGFMETKVERKYR